MVEMSSDSASWLSFSRPRSSRAGSSGAGSSRFISLSCSRDGSANGLVDQLGTLNDAVAAGRLARGLEPLHSQVYFAPEGEPAYTAAGLEPGRMSYFAPRAAPMGAVGASVVTATFYNFSPRLVAKSVPRAWELVSAPDLLDVRFAVADASLRRTLGDDAVASPEMAEAAGLARTAAGAVTPDGRPLAAGHLDVPWPTAPHLVLWHALSILREHRGDGHIALLVEAGLSGLEALVTATATGTATTQSTFRPGQRIRVPNIGGDRIEPGAIGDRNWQRTLASLGVGSDQPEVDRIVVSKAGKTLKAYQGDKLVALFTVSSGSSEFPLPLGEWDIVGEAYNPTYSYDPEVLGKNGSDDGTHEFAPGPNSPVGVVWIDLSKDHYGIHGTPDPETIGRAQSSGCVRLTNWDAARLAGMVSQSTQVIFEA